MFHGKNIHVHVLGLAEIIAFRICALLLQEWTEIVLKTYSDRVRVSYETRAHGVEESALHSLFPVTQKCFVNLFDDLVVLIHQILNQCERTASLIELVRHAKRNQCRTVKNHSPEILWYRRSQTSVVHDSGPLLIPRFRSKNTQNNSKTSTKNKPIYPNVQTMCVLNGYMFLERDGWAPVQKPLNAISHLGRSDGSISDNICSQRVALAVSIFK